MPLRILIVLLAAAGLSGIGGPIARSAQDGRTPRILYATDWAGPTEIFAVDPSGKAPRTQVTAGAPPGCVISVLACGYYQPFPSPDGRHVAFRAVPPVPLGTGGDLWLGAVDGSSTRLLTTAWQPSDPVWSPDSRRIAYVSGSQLHVVRADGSRDRIVNRNASGTPLWSKNGRSVSTVSGTPSPDGRFVAEVSARRIDVADAHTGRVWHLTDALGLDPGIRRTLAWSPDSRLLAYLGPDAIRVLYARTGRTRPLTSDQAFDLAWSPDSRTLAYVQGRIWADYALATGDLRTVDLSGHVRTVAPAAAPYGGHIVSVAWTRAPTGMRYRPPLPVDGIYAGGTVPHLEADGARVAFVACRHVFAWTPGTGETLQIDSGKPQPCMSPQSRDTVTDLALAGDRVAWAEKGSGLSFRWTVWAAQIGPSPTPLELARGGGDLGSPPEEGVGTLEGSGSLLVDSSWEIDPHTHELHSQTVHRIDPQGCPCPAIASSPGPFTPFDVDAGRIVAGGDNATLLLDRDGTQLLSILVSPLAAALSGRDLVLLVRGGLLDYDAATGQLLQRWPLPDVTSGRDCDLYADPDCPSSPPRLFLEDSSRGLVAYVLEARVHVLRLADGADAVVAAGTLARFMDAGLVYADGARIHLVPFSQLPLR